MPTVYILGAGKKHLLLVTVGRIYCQLGLGLLYRYHKACCCCEVILDGLFIVMWTPGSVSRPIKTVKTVLEGPCCYGNIEVITIQSRQTSAPSALYNGCSFEL